MTAVAPRVLVVVASKHGATAEIADALARGLADCPAGRAARASAVAVRAEQRPNPAPFDAVLLGGACYAARWLRRPRQDPAAYEHARRAGPVWLFPSGPMGEPPFPPDEPHDV